VREAGRELDAEIARRIMGVEAHQAKTGDMIFTIHRDFIDDGDYWYYREGWGYDEVPHYSTDIAAAWQVVERVRTFNKGDEIGLEVSVIALSDHYDCHIETNSSAYLVVEEADTAPLAICLAALHVVGVSL
jgi:hypothetical protein